ncbi:sugar phosphate isomerase/epimerase family protein [Paraglaciecola psychrophila]|uniref:Xylose isomerase domain-containing protein TIM barrel n=1 Tax=Paraglaciecola psychrophila 170 TaxID=1129794 RepID=K7A631_9ALTE|nr:sugar phosphate isomerase/epimerase [Paraglaciecola psychrophila]AGH44748.1 xylose isomerase domain-containing protein TIM barrel [Paraglaciecola psychrophila 170]GAC37782.1 sugar phosphate isomerase/epimerase [Paraglaciecola psychrophila 170]
MNHQNIYGLNPSESQTELALDRRRFMKLSSIILGASLLPGSLAFAADKPSAVGLQLYTLRDMMAVSVPATLKLVSAVGYKEVETAGYFEYSPREFRKMLDGEGLTSPSAHIRLDLFDKSLNQVIDTAKEVGHEYVVIPYLTVEQRGSGINVYKKLAENCNVYGEACKKVGLKLAYHNHDFEFEMRDGQLPYDVLLQDVDADLMAMEMDLYWMVKAKQDPLAYFKRHPGRFKLWHVKDMDKQGAFADVGTGIIDFPAIFAHAKQAGVEHKVVERDMTDNIVKTIQQGYKAVSALSKA